MWWESGAVAVRASYSVQGNGVVRDGLRGEERGKKPPAKTEKSETKEAAKDTGAKETKESKEKKAEKKKN